VRQTRSAASATVLMLLVFLGTSACNRAKACDACGRHASAQTSLAIQREDGSRQEACCARCGAHLLATGSAVSSVRVRDFETSEWLDAARAVFVEGSDVHPCRGLITEPPRDDRGCCRTAAFDRCEPSLLAFRSPEAARAFMAVHGGTSTSWQAVAGPHTSH
jgi:hypothetical protein